MIDAIDRIFTDAMRRAVPIAGGHEVIRALHAEGYVMGLASSDSEAAIDVFLENSGLAPYFQFTAGYDSGFGHKPSPGMLSAFCSSMGTPAQDTATVGDNVQNLQLARAGNAGLAIGVLSGTGTQATLAPLADIINPDISHLERAFAEWTIRQRDKVA